jgi:2-hydroxychromene-2-carboxylate isomerase
MTDFVNAVMRPIWAEDQNVADPGILIAIADRAALRTASYTMQPLPRRCAASTMATPLAL